MDERIEQLRASLGPQAEVMKERALEVAAAARERFSGGGRAIREFTERKPAQALGLALGVGVFLGWLLKRR